MFSNNFFLNPLKNMNKYLLFLCLVLPLFLCEEHEDYHTTPEEIDQEVGKIPIESKIYIYF